MQIKFDDIIVPTEKLDQVVAQNLYDIKRKYKKRKQWNYLIRGMAAAAIALAITGVFAANPALAAKLPLIGHIFEKVQDDQMYPGKFDEVAEPVSVGNVSESEGITMTLSEIYSDSRSMYVSAMIESEEPFPDQVKESNIVEGDEIGYHMYLSIEQEFDFMTPPETYEAFEWPGEEYEWTSLDLKGEYVDEHTFVGAMRISYNEYPVAGYDVPDTFRWKLKVNGMENMYYSKAGTWEFETDVSVDRTGVKVIDVNQSAPNGEVIQSVTMTPYEVAIDYSYDESKVKPEYEKYDLLQSVMLDADGKLIVDKVGVFSPERYHLSEITIYYFEAPSDEVYTEIQEKLYDETLKDQLRNYLEEISVHKIVISLE